MKKRRQFTPEFVDSLEERALLSSFLPALGPVTTLGFSGNRVLTSTTYTQVHNTLNAAFTAFENNFVRAFNAAGGYGTALNTALGSQTAGLATPAANTPLAAGSYRTGLLGQIDRAMLIGESRIPFGLGLRPPLFTGGVGLSTLTAPTSAANATKLSVAQTLDNQLNSAGAVVGTLNAAGTPLNGAAARAAGVAAIETVRQGALSIAGVTGQTPGVLPNYIELFGPHGARNFGLKNT